MRLFQILGTDGARGGISPKSSLVFPKLLKLGKYPQKIMSIANQLNFDYNYVTLFNL